MPLAPKFSQNELARRAAKYARLGAQARLSLERARNARLVAGLLLTASLAVATAFPRSVFGLSSLALFLAIFPPLVVASRKREKAAKDRENLARFYERALLRFTGHAPPELALNKSDLSKDLPPDLGLEGAHSLMSWLDETWTDSGRAALAQRLARDPLRPSPEPFSEKQRKTKALTAHRWPLMRLGLSCDRDSARLSTFELERFVKNPLLPPSARRTAAINLAFYSLFIASVLSVSLSSLPRAWITLSFVAYVFVSALTMSGWEKVFSKAQGFATHLGVLYPLFLRLEALTRSSAIASELVPELARRSPAADLRKLEWALALASVESNPIVQFLANALLPITVIADLWLERIRSELAIALPMALKELSEFEAWSSLALYASIHGGAWPETASDLRLEFEALAHPLLARSKAVTNSLCLSRSGKSVALLTGSNMSGKSTFLRAIGLNQALANAGTTVRAEKFQTPLLDIETCIQVADSLANGVSYFYAEVLRLKNLLSAAQSGAPTLVLIDEIFRGTNNRERRLGSEAVIRSLAKSKNVIALVSTHDLELAELESACEGVGNWHFRDEVDPDGRLRFEYRLAAGPCPTTNALKLMRLEGLPVPEA